MLPIYNLRPILAILEGPRCSRPTASPDSTDPPARMIPHPVTHAHATDTLVPGMCACVYVHTTHVAGRGREEARGRKTAARLCYASCTLPRSVHTYIHTYHTHTMLLRLLGDITASFFSSPRPTRAPLHTYQSTPDHGTFVLIFFLLSSLACFCLRRRPLRCSQDYGVVFLPRCPMHQSCPLGLW